MYVYFFRCGHQIKIGKSKDILRRIKELQTGNPEKIEFVGWMELEDDKPIHALFEKEHILGEWFNSSPGLTEYMKQNIRPPEEYLKEKIGIETIPLFQAELKVVNFLDEIIIVTPRGSISLTQSEIHQLFDELKYIVEKSNARS